MSSIFVKMRRQYVSKLYFDGTVVTRSTVRPIARQMAAKGDLFASAMDGISAAQCNTMSSAYREHGIL